MSSKRGRAPQQGPVRALAARAEEVARDGLDPIERYVHEKPVKSLLIAAGITVGIGALVGAYFWRRS